MANSDYTYAQVKAGTGTYVEEATPKESAGVKTMQIRLNSCGYNLTENGKFNSVTTTAVKAFQKECNLSVDGKVGKNTLVQLDKVYTSSYFTTYGIKITSSKWGRAFILTGAVEDVDLIARCIWVEERELIDPQIAVAQVIKNRSASTSSSYIASASSYPNASKWARVLGCSGQYASATDSAAYTPIRGDANASDGISSIWKNAVDIAKKLVNGTSYTVPKGYTVDTSGNISSTKTTAVSSQMMQTAHSSFTTARKGSIGIKNAVTYKPNFNGLANVFWDYNN